MTLCVVQDFADSLIVWANDDDSLFLHFIVESSFGISDPWRVSLGDIGGFCGDYGTGLYAGEDGNMYFAPTDTWIDQDDDTGMLTILVRGPYDIHALRGRNVLNPSPPMKFPVE